MKTNFIFLATLLITNLTYSQININYPYTGRGNFSYTTKDDKPKEKFLSATLEIASNGDTIFTEKYDNPDKNSIFKGTPFYQNGNNNYGHIYIDGKKTEGNILFNITKVHLVQFSTDNFNTLTVVKPDSFKVAGAKFVKLNNLYQDAYQYYYQLLYNDGNNQVYKLNICELIINNNSNNYSKNGYHELGTKYNGYYEKSMEYFMPNGPYFVKIKPNSNFINQLGFYSKDLGWYASTKQLDFKKEKDILDFVKYYSYLVEK